MRFAVISSILNALITVALQLEALLFLSPGGYGEFALRFLIFGLALSLSYTLITDVWTRGGHREGWDEYGAPLLWYCLIVVVIGFGALLVLGTPIAEAAIFAAAVGLAVYRHGARYFAAYRDRWRPVVIADAAGVVAIVLTFVVARLFLTPFAAVSVAWVVASLAAIALSDPVRFAAPRALTDWISQRWGSIRGLWVDTALLDVGNIAGPLVLAPFMSAAKFGVYRGVSSAAVPVRLLLSPLRAQLGRSSAAWFSTGRTIAFAAALGLGLGAAVAVGVVLVGGLPALGSTVIPLIVPYAAAAGLFTFASCVSYFYYIGARSHLSHRGLRVGRIFETAVMTALPLVGFALFGLTGAVWGYAIGATINAVRWVTLVRSPRHHLATAE